MTPVKRNNDLKRRAKVAAPRPYCQFPMLRRLPFSPRALRFFVVALALVQFVAPTWHICALGGHICGTRTAAHHGASPVTEFNGENAPMRPLICVCAAPLPPLDSKTARLDGVSHTGHSTCLALLLQTMPGQTAVAPAVFEPRALSAVHGAALTHIAPSLAPSRGFRGRAPPKIG